MSGRGLQVSLAAVGEPDHRYVDASGGDGQPTAPRMRSHRAADCPQWTHRASGPDFLVCVVERPFVADEMQGDGQARTLAGLDQIFASSWVGGAGKPGFRRGPGGDEVAFGLVERDDVVDAVQFPGW